MCTPVQLNNRQLGVLIHRLQRVGQAIAPHERGAQHLMTRQQSAPGGAKTLHLQTLHRHAELVDVQVQFRRFNTVEQHALLHRRQRIQVIQHTAIHRHRIGHLGKRQGLNGRQRGWPGINRHRCQRPNGLRFEQLLGRKRQPQHPGAADRLQRNNRVAAQLKEIFGDANGLQP